jgi:hypothetical protein
MLVYRQDGYKLMDIDLFGKGAKLAKRDIIVMGRGGELRDEAYEHAGVARLTVEHSLE